MKTLIDLPTSLHQRAHCRASEQGVTLAEVVVEALEKELSPSRTTARTAHDRHFEIDSFGVPLLRRIPGDTTVVTAAFIERLRDQQGI
ncbi:type II toxin-antitoxin system HicB family antitoxin [Luteolibacter flavescens]|uniref:Type II toxin-antitoxin system HicB family antitoxin n=1 Tax=Luteolibacter flavescens TaxID=1859460 RepID=A0ABT3FVD0_9BACT|nr:type II toxin-antitoxin system HicB family antitoxin [Luteolibacter flavescens]MCW1887507.1 type II toxin-antitoxin system HicB family antitoxin [Luteolibacter flavescens]